jgi:hypothetical protein
MWTEAPAGSRRSGVFPGRFATAVVLVTVAQVLIAAGLVAVIGLWMTGAG